MSGAMRPLALAALLAGLALGGCSSVAEDAQESSLAALETQEPPPRNELPTPKDCAKTDLTSLPALRALPRPGHMPAGSFMQRIQHAGKLVAGVDQNSLGLGYFNPVTGEIEGFDIDVVKEVAAAIFGDPAGHVVYKAISTPQREAAIYFQDVDIVASAFSVTCKRQQNMSFSAVYHHTRQRLLVPDDSDVDELEDLRGKKVCVTKRSTSIETLERTGVVPFGVDLRSDCLVALQEREVAAITSDEAILYGFCQQDPQTKIVGPNLGDEHHGLAINRRHADFVRFVNAVLERSRARRGQSRRHWLGGLEGSGDEEISDCSRPETS